MKRLLYVVLILIVLLSMSCFPYMYYDREKVLLNDIDINQTLEVAKAVLDKGGFGSILSIWVIRDQIISSSQAKEISLLYFKYIGKIKDNFEIWHFAWAISNLYREGDEGVKKELETAYQDAKKRPKECGNLAKIADEFVNGNKVYMGDIHDLGRAYARSHIVVPGNKKYLQSFDEYKNKIK